MSYALATYFSWGILFYFRAIIFIVQISEITLGRPLRGAIPEQDFICIPRKASQQSSV